MPIFSWSATATTITNGMSAHGGDPSLMEIIHHPEHPAALRAAIELVRDGKADILMKGSVDTGTMMKAVLEESSGLRTGRLLSDIFVLEYPPRMESKFIMITDGGMTLAPDLKNKVELIRNAVEVAHALGNPQPEGCRAFRDGVRPPQSAIHPGRGGALEDERARADHRLCGGRAVRA